MLDTETIQLQQHESRRFWTKVKGVDELIKKITPPTKTLHIKNEFCDRMSMPCMKLGSTIPTFHHATYRAHCFLHWHRTLALDVNHEIHDHSIWMINSWGCWAYVKFHNTFAITTCRPNELLFYCHVIEAFRYLTPWLVCCPDHL